MGDIVERLRGEAETEVEWSTTHKILVEAADEIANLRAENAAIRGKAIEEAAQVADKASAEWESDSKLWHKEGMLKTAAASLLHSDAATKVAAAIRKLKEKAE